MVTTVLSRKGLGLKSDQDAHTVVQVRVACNGARAFLCRLGDLHLAHSSLKG